jgi:hypothetical protein
MTNHLIQPNSIYQKYSFIIRGYTLPRKETKHIYYTWVKACAAGINNSKIIIACFWILSVFNMFDVLYILIIF